ncbi:hypothetical protein [Nocardia sp. CNY236]|nr:hypothetical protein [Nocardia sp. CNY236]
MGNIVEDHAEYHDLLGGYDEVDEVDTGAIASRVCPEDLHADRA